MAAFTASPGIPAPPWHSKIDAVLWLHRAVPGARDALPAPLAARAGLPITMGGLISYRDGPVGPYGEVFGAPVMLRGTALLSHVAFMAVDSERSVAGGRGNWALPKELATFEGDPGLPGAVTARARDWELSVTTTARTRRFPLWLTLWAAQPRDDGSVRRFSVRMRGSARMATAAVEHGAPGPPARWLAEGHHQAVLLAGVQDVSPPRAG